jgi:hypothetical protein
MDDVQPRAKKEVKFRQISLSIAITPEGPYLALAGTDTADNVWIYGEDPTHVLGWRLIPLPLIDG